MRIPNISLRDASGFFLDQTGDFTSALNGVIHFVSGERGNLRWIHDCRRGQPTQISIVGNIR